jgi:predicted aminopeptidase
LEHLCFSLRRLPAVQHEWKWAIIAAHSVLQGSLICVLLGKDDKGHLSEASRKDFFRWVEDSRTNPAIQRPKERVADFPALLKRAKNPAWMSMSDGMPIKLGADADRDLKRLHELRNEFMHFSAPGWSIEVAGLPRIVNVPVKLAQLLLLTHPASTLRLYDSEKVSRFADLFKQVAGELKRLGADGLPDEIPAAERLAKPEL